MSLRFAFCLCVFILHVCTLPVTSTQTNTKNVLLVSIPLPGHVNPLISQAQELIRRGWNVELACPSRLRKHIMEYLPMENYVEIKGCESVVELLPKHLQSAALTNDWLESTSHMYNWTVQLQPCMYQSLLSHVRSKSNLPDLIVADIVTHAAIDIADQFNIKHVINNADLLNMLVSDDVGTYDYLPSLATGHSLEFMTSPDNFYGLAMRSILPPLRALITVAANKQQDEMNAQRQALGLPPISIFSHLNNRIVLVNGAFGLEYPRPLPPSIFMTGPLLLNKFVKNVSVARHQFASELSAEDREWMNQGNRPIVYVSMGTIAPLNEQQVLAFHHAFQSAGSLPFRVLWKLNQHESQFLPANVYQTTAHLRIVSWVSSQMGVLSHPHTRLFFSHCGINSVQESVYVHIPMLCLPIIADQNDMAQRVVDRKIGLKLEKQTFTSTNITQSILHLLQAEQQHQLLHAVKLARSALYLAGGVEKAVDILEHVVEFGSDGLVPVHTSYPWYAKYNFDVYFVWAITFIIMKKLICCCCCCGCRRNENTKTEAPLKKKLQ